MLVSPLVSFRLLLFPSVSFCLLPSPSGSFHLLPTPFVSFRLFPFSCFFFLGQAFAGCRLAMRSPPPFPRRRLSLATLLGGCAPPFFDCSDGSVLGMQAPRSTMRGTSCEWRCVCAPAAFGSGLCHAGLGCGSANVHPPYEYTTHTPFKRNPEVPPQAT